jgi:hypothetical protein
MPLIKIIRKYFTLDVKVLKQLIMSYMQYEDAMKVYEYFELPEPVRPLALNITDIFNFLTPECFNTSIYIPVEYEGKFDLMDLFELDHVRVAYSKFIYFQCKHCLSYNKLNFTFSKVHVSNAITKPPELSLHLVVKQVKDVIQGIPGRKFLCECLVRSRTGSYKIQDTTITGDDWIKEFLGKSLIPSPQRRRL